MSVAGEYSVVCGVLREGGATDFALAKAVGWNAKVILSVPCCQHELNRQIKNEILAPILKYGLIKERLAALVTDAMRAEYLEGQGYDAQILEFIDMEHTPKNILIRAVKVNYLPRKVLMCCKIKARQLGISIPKGGDPGDHDAAANMNSFTVAGLDNANLTAMSEERLEEYVRQLHYIFLAGYVVNVRRLMFVEDTFFDPCKTLYGTEVERDKNVQLPAEDYLKLGFFPADGRDANQ